MPKLHLWSRSEYESWGRRGGGREDVSEAWIVAIEALPIGSEGSPFVGRSGEALDWK